MDKAEWRRRISLCTFSEKCGETHTVIDQIGGDTPPAPELDDGKPQLAGADRGDTALAIGMNGTNDGRSRQMACMGGEKIVRAPKQLDHSIEMLGGAA